ncbi:hypothetical protein CLF_100534 [Clonorchis sinensis]|uniref:Uncharacterized protein n=1 Tax=Clonorchis sinensis TaxID=79923 RepID=G7Y3N9_CLOSI|nr:hypothetical protein CLF_100534 [Clonorchis sinensis]
MGTSDVKHSGPTKHSVVHSEGIQDSASKTNTVFRRLKLKSPTTVVFAGKAEQLRINVTVPPGSLSNQVGAHSRQIAMRVSVSHGLTNRKEATAEPNTRNGMALTMEQLHPGSTEMEPPSSASTIRTLRSRSQIVPPPLPPISTSYDLKIPPTPRRAKPSWVIHDMDGTKPTLRISQQARSERRHDVYVNAAKCPAPDHNGSQPNGRSAVGRLSPPAVWTQLLPYRVSTVPPNLSERLKKSETLPNDVWTYSQSPTQDHSQRAVSGVVSGTKDQQLDDIRHEGPRSPPPRPPMRTTSQIPSSMCVKDHLGATGHASSARKTGIQQKGVSNYQSLADMYGMRESFDNSPVLCRYAQLYSMPFHPKTPTTRRPSGSITKAQQASSTVSIHSPLKENRGKSPASYMERLHLAE